MNRSYSRRSLIRLAAGAALGGTALPLIASSRAVYAQAGDTQLVCNADSVNVRDNPGLSSTVIDQLNTGDIVNLIGGPDETDGYTWLQVAGYGGNIESGWVAAEFLDTPGTGGWDVGTHVYVAVDGLNLRDAPGLRGSVIMTVGRNVHAITRRAAQASDGYTWYGVVLDNGTEGFFAGEFLSTTPPNDATGGWQAGTSVRVIADGLRLRSGPGTDYGIITAYSRGDDGQVLEGPSAGSGYEWYKVEMYGDGNIGWLAANYLEIARYEPTGSRLRVVNGPLNLREWGSLSAPVITVIPTGDVVVVANASLVQADGYTWWDVYLEDDPGVRGWIADGFTEEIG